MNTCLKQVPLYTYCVSVKPFIFLSTGESHRGTVREGERDRERGKHRERDRDKESER